MKKNKSVSDIGVVIGRFQVQDLHSAHLDLINMVCSKHGKVAIFLGVSPVLGSTVNPLDFPVREAMLKAMFPKVVVVPIPDRCSNAVWSHDLDARIRELFPVGSVSLYGGRDSFAKGYKGKFPVIEMEPVKYVSGTDMRKAVSNQILSDPKFRAGIIYASFAQHHNPKPTVDIAVIQEQPDRHGRILLCRKADEILAAQYGEGELWRFPGGFVDAKDESLENAAKREIREEGGINMEVADMNYVCSMRVSDWRYAKELSKIMTSFFVTTHMYGAPQPGDDVAEMQWFPITDKLIAKIRPAHRMLYIHLLDYIHHKDVNGLTFIEQEEPAPTKKK